MGSLDRQLRGLGPGGSSPAYELMNEPNGLMAKGRTWTTPVDYARSACAAYRIIHAADPSATVIVGSLNLTDWQDWLRTALHAGLADCFDVFSALCLDGSAARDSRHGSRGGPFGHPDLGDRVR